jgi:hypothetical protein
VRLGIRASLQVALQRAGEIVTAALRVRARVGKGLQVGDPEVV